MNAHARVRRSTDESSFTRPYDLDADGQPIMRSAVEKFAALKAHIDAAIARGGAYTSEEVAAYVEARLAATSGSKD